MMYDQYRMKISQKYCHMVSLPVYNRLPAFLFYELLFMELNLVK
jgi:hypothetical protein